MDFSSYFRFYLYIVAVVIVCVSRGNYSVRFSVFFFKYGKCRIIDEAGALN